MKIITKIGLLTGAFTAHNSNAFVATRLKGKSATQHLSKVPPRNMQSDDDLFKDLFNTTQHDNEKINDAMVFETLKELKNAQQKKVEEIILNQTDFLTDLEFRTDNLTNKQLIDKIDKKIPKNNINNDNVISDKKDIFLTSFVVTLSDFIDNDNRCNEIYIDKNNIKNSQSLKIICKDLSIKGDNTYEKIFTLMNTVKFDPKFLQQKQFVQTINKEIMPKMGFVLRGTYQDKDVYFLMTRTRDDNLRLIDISQSQYQLGETF